ncbi:glutathione S-transferase [Novosphingobium aerophilum]|uniref:glutathione S-transferase family protein n=1 Tax=Novosphingobium TaxID=165696 RepID=UPI002D766320|nr:glutathione S-transferase [Novosphingobium sp. RL4]WRT94828.1 glutathione S-transferase [Novosphingobium sp. RL4]
MIAVHHLENSRSQRILWLLEELGLPYRVVHYARDKATMLAPPELRAVHPLGKSPVIVDEDAGDGPLTIAETGAIIEYLVGKADGRLGVPEAQIGAVPEAQGASAPEAREAALRYRYYLHYAEGSLMPPLLIKLVLGMIPVVGGFAQKKVQPMIDVHLDFVESELASRPWFAGDAFTAADVMMSFPLEAARDRAGLDASRPATTAWLEKIHARPAYQAALAAGGPYRYA